MHPLIDGAGGPMILADEVLAVAAANHLIATDRLTRAAGTEHATVAAQPTLATGRRLRRELRMRIAYDAGADRARRGAVRAHRVFALGADRFVARAVRLPARGAGSGVLRAGRLAIDSACNDAVVPAERLVAHAACQGTGITREM